MNHKTVLLAAGLLALALMPGSAVAQIAPGPGYYDHEIAPEAVYHRGYAYRRVIIRRGYNPWRGPYAGRGFMDPGFAYQGNIPGCAVDLGYGRYEPCR